MALRIGAACAVAVSAAPAAAADWQATERTKTYAISGATGMELYTSIGEHGPVVGKTRAIAHTTFDLKWRQDYRPQPDGSCALASAKPFLTITYTLPKPSGKLPPAARAYWDTFIEGIRRHEKVHGDHIREMTETILATTVGLAVPGDAGCKKIRDAVVERVTEAFNAQRQKGRDFDRAEMSGGGNVHNLILQLVNGR